MRQRPKGIMRWMPRQDRSARFGAVKRLIKVKVTSSEEAAERTDHVSPETRSSIMRAVKSRGARSTERRLRAAIVASGVSGWRMHAGGLPGRPDFVFPDDKVAVFVDGCFWHGCPKCYRRPHSSQSYWDAKVAGNIARDKSRRAELKKLGWRVLRFWEHEVKASASAAVVRIKAQLKPPAT